MDTRGAPPLARTRVRDGATPPCPLPSLHPESCVSQWSVWHPEHARARGSPDPHPPPILRTATAAHRRLAGWCGSGDPRARVTGDADAWSHTHDSGCSPLPRHGCAPSPARSILSLSTAPEEGIPFAWPMAPSAAPESLPLPPCRRGWMRFARTRHWRSWVHWFARS